MKMRSHLGPCPIDGEGELYCGNCDAICIEPTPYCPGAEFGGRWQVTRVLRLQYEVDKIGFHTKSSYTAHN